MKEPAERLQNEELQQVKTSKTQQSPPDFSRSYEKRNKNVAVIDRVIHKFTISTKTIA